jgi:hypothetical protein
MDGAYSKAIPVDKISYALDAVTRGKAPARGDLGAALRLLPAGVARRSYRLPADAVPAPTDGGTPSVIAVSSLLPGVEAAGGLQPGDVIATVAGAKVGDDLLALDRAANAKVGKSVPVVVYRNGTRVELRAVPVRDLEALKVKRFARYGGGTFHGLSDGARYELPAAGSSKGVLMPEAEPGTPFARLTAVRPAATTRAAAATDSYVDGGGRMLVTQINGKKVETLDDLIAAARAVADGAAGYAVARDLTTVASPPGGKATELTFNVARYPLQVFEWDAKQLDWVSDGGTKVVAAAAAAPAAARAPAPAAAAAAVAAPSSKAKGRTLLQEGKQPTATTKKGGADTDAAPAARAALPPPPPAGAATAASWSSPDKARFRRGTVAVRRVTDVPLDDAARGDSSHSGVVVSVDDTRVVIATVPASVSPTMYDVTFYDGSTAKARGEREARERDGARARAGQPLPSPPPSIRPPFSTRTTPSSWASTAPTPPPT